jgi:hypothetical protein
MERQELPALPIPYEIELRKHAGDFDEVNYPFTRDDVPREDDDESYEGEVFSLALSLLSGERVFLAVNTVIDDLYRLC